MIELIIGGAILFVAVIIFIATYKVVEPNEAHVTIFMGRGRKFYGPIDGKKTAYFFIPVIMKRYILPLTNVKMNIEDIDLNDSEVAPFICDVITWVRISDPVLAAERLDLNTGAFRSLQSDLINIVQAIARAVSMKQEIIEIMRDRKTFAASVSAEVEPVLKEWGVQLVNLEVNEIRDAEGSSVIGDYESIREAQIKTNARIEIAERDKEATVAEQENYRLSQIATAVAQEASEKRFVEKDKVVGIAQQENERDVAEQEELANKQKVEAKRTLDVGGAEVEKQATIQVATGIAEAVRIKGDREAQVITLTGTAEGKAISAKGLAEAEAKEKMAEAMAKFNNAATGIEKIRAYIEVEKIKYESLALALSSADLKLVNSGNDTNLFGFPISATAGADMAQMIEAAGGTEAVSSLVEEVVDKIK